MKVGGSMELLIGLVMLIIGCAILFVSYIRGGLRQWLREFSKFDPATTTSWKPFFLVVVFLLIVIGIVLINRSITAG